MDRPTYKWNVREIEHYRNATRGSSVGERPLQLDPNEGAHPTDKRRHGTGRVVSDDQKLIAVVVGVPIAIIALIVLVVWLLS